MSSDVHPATRETVNASSYSSEERRTAAQLIEENYPLLQQIARAKRRRSEGTSTLATMDILHESYLKLNGEAAWQSSEHFVRAASLAMRCVIVDYARRKHAAKRGGAVRAQSFEEDDSLLPEFNETPEQVVAIADVLEKLAAHW